MRDTRAVAGGGRQGDDRLAALRAGRAADEVHLAADAAVEVVCRCESAHTWPVRSTSMRRVDGHHAVVLGDQERVVGVLGRVEFEDRVVVRRSRTAARARARSRRSILPGWMVLRSPVMTPCSTRSITPSENISVWTPRSCLSCRAASTASGMPPMPDLEGRAVLDQLGDVPADRRSHVGVRLGLASRGSGSSTSTMASTSLTWRKLSPSVRGMLGFTSAMTIWRALARRSA